MIFLIVLAVIVLALVSRTLWDYVVLSPKRR